MFSHHLLIGASFMVSNGKTYAALLPLGTDGGVNGWKVNHTSKHNVMALRKKKSKKQYVSTSHIPVHFELNHTSPCAAFMAAERLSTMILFHIQSHQQFFVWQTTHTHYCCLSSSPLSLVGHSTTHCDNSWIWKTIQKQLLSSPPLLLLPFPAH